MDQGNRVGWKGRQAALARHADRTKLKVKHPDNKNPVEEHQKKKGKKVSTVLSKK